MIEETWTLAPAASAAGVPLAFAKRALDRALLEPDVQGRGAGCYRELARATIYKIALIWILSQLGLPPGLAACHAAAFTDRGQPDRAVSELFANGTTWLVISQSGAPAVINAPVYASVGDVVALTGASRSSAIVVNLNEIVAEVDSRLRIVNSPARLRHGQPHLELKGIT